MGNRGFIKAKKFPKPSIKTALGIKARCVNTIIGMFLSVLFNFGSLSFKAALVITTTYISNYCYFIAPQIKS
ncbi:MAG: hypothetical protein NC452_16455 [Eubacterium sp.]|nr:hypothetical protein [Eubacterium sp.]